MTITDAAFSAGQLTYIAELNSLVTDINTNAASIDYVDDTVAGGMLTGSSTTSNSVGTGAKTFTVEAGRAWVVGAVLRISNTVTPTNYMVGYITSYSGTTLDITITSTGGSGTFASWALGLEGAVSTTVVFPQGRSLFFN